MAEQLRLEADARWVFFIRENCGYRATYLYIMLSTLFAMHQRDGEDKALVTCSAWEDLNMQQHHWYRALWQLRRVGAITTCKKSHRIMEVAVTQEPPKYNTDDEGKSETTIEKEVERYDYANN